MQDVKTVKDIRGKGENVHFFLKNSTQPYLQAVDR